MEIEILDRDKLSASNIIKTLIKERVAPKDEHLARLLLELVTHVNIEAYDRGAYYERRKSTK